MHVGIQYPRKYHEYCICVIMSHVTRKPVFGVCDQVRLKPAWSATETRYRLEISAIASIGIILSRQRITKALIRLHKCAGWSAPLLFAYGKSRFCHDVARIMMYKVTYSQCSCAGLDFVSGNPVLSASPVADNCSS